GTDHVGGHQPGLGSLLHRPGPDRPADVAHRQLAQGSHPHRGAAHPVGALRAGPDRDPAELLRGAVPLPVAVLLAVRVGIVRAWGPGLRHLVRALPAAGPAGHPRPAVPAGLPADVLLLPPRVLPLLLALPAGLRRAGR